MVTAIFLLELQKDSQYLAVLVVHFKLICKITRKGYLGGKCQASIEHLLYLRKVFNLTTIIIHVLQVLMLFCRCRNPRW